MYSSAVAPGCVVPEQRGGVAPALLAQVSAMGDEALTVRARELAGEISAAEANLAVVLAEIERREIHSAWECRSIERFAGWHLQHSPTRARSLAEVGRAMATLPVMAEAVADGTLGFDKAKAISRVAAPESESALVDLVLHATTAQTQRICGQWRKVEARDRTDPESQRAVDRPTVLVVHDDDGVTLTIHLDHVLGELVVASIDTAAAQVRTERAHAAPVDAGNANGPSGRPACDEDLAVEKLTTAEWRAEGLLRLAQRSATEAPEGLTSSGFATTVVVHVGIDTLHGPDLTDAGASTTSSGTGTGTGTGGDDVGITNDDSRSLRHQRRDQLAELEPTGVAVRRDIARWLACDAGLLTVIEDPDGNPLHAGTLTTSIPVAIRRAVMARYRTCAWPGCTATAVQLHHIRHRSAGGLHDPENLAPECLTHHQIIHSRGIWITRDPDGTLHHRRPDGTEITANPRVATTGPDAIHAPDRLTQRRLALGADPHETARQPRWHGDPAHLGDCIEAVQARRDRALQGIRPTGAPPNLN